MQVSCTLHFKGSKRYRLIFEKNNNDSDNKQKSLINMQGWTRNLRTTTTWKFFFLFLNLSAVPKKSTPGKFAYFRPFQRNSVNANTFEKTRIHFKGDVFAAVAVAVAVAVVVKVPYCLWRNFSAGGIVLCEVILRCDQRCNISKRENERTHFLFLSVTINHGA